MRSKMGAVLGSLAFLILAPGTVAGVIPYWITAWRVRGRPPGGVFAQGLGALLIGAGLVVLLDSFVRFALQGRGTPAPVLPTRSLVVTGFYRYVRNPMYVAVLSLVLGQSLLLGSLRLLLYAAALAIGFDTSAGEKVQQWLPGAKVVKAYNTVGAPLMVDPSFQGGLRGDMFIAGDDPQAKAKVAEIIRTFGWDVVDVGGIRMARVLEPLCELWVTVGLGTGTWNHAYKLIRT